MSGYWTLGGMSAVPPGTGYYGSVPIEDQAPPSTYAVASVLEGEPGSLARLVGVTTIRAVFIVPGIWVGDKLVGGGLPIWKVAVVSMLASVSISAGMLAWYALKRGVGRNVLPNPPAMSGRS